MKKAGFCIISFFYLLPLVSNCQDKNGTVKIIFRNSINGQPLVLNDSNYTNAFGESFTIAKFKYYISHITMSPTEKKPVEKELYFLADQSIDSSLNICFEIPEDDYTGFGFLLGVDSIKNTSGAQTGALDPLNDMFWTWNTGYIMFKIEGNSPQSNVVNNKIEYHIGGFSGENNVLQEVRFAFPADKNLQVRKGKTSTIIMDVNLDKYWQGDTILKISDTPVCTSPGLLAKKIAINFSGIFSVTSVINND